MVIKVSTLLDHNTTLQNDTAPTLGGPLNTNNFPIENGGSPVTITGNEYPINTGSAGQVLTTNGLGVLSWQNTVTQIIAGSNITITPIGGTGAVTINSTGGGGGSGTVTSVAIASPGSTISVAGSPVTTSGTIDIDLVNSGVAAGGYGSGSSVSTFTVNAKGILTLASNTPISITPSQAGLGNVTNSLQVINAGGSPSITTGSGAPSGSSNPGALYVDQAVTNGQGIYTYTGSTWVPVSEALKLYSENVPGTYVAPSAGSVNSVALGEGATTTNGAINALAIGNQSLGRIQGGVVQASGRFSTTGDAQTGRYLLRGFTTAAFPAELFIDGNGLGGSSVRLVLPDNATWTYRVTVTAHRTDTSTGHGAFEAKGLIYRASGAATTSLQGTVNNTVISDANNGWSINISADPINGSLKITVTGSAGNTIRWLALVETVEVTN